MESLFIIEFCRLGFQGLAVESSDSFVIKYVYNLINLFIQKSLNESHMG